MASKEKEEKEMSQNLKKLTLRNPGGRRPSSARIARRKKEREEKKRRKRDDIQEGQ